MGTVPHAGVDVALRDGRTVHVRPVRPDDVERLARLLARLSDRDLVFRFFGAGIHLERTARRLAVGEHGTTLVATTGSDGEIVAHAAYVRDGPDEAEVAFAIAGEWQGQGLATTLLVELAEAAAAEGIGVFSAVVLPENRRMIDVFRHSGFAVEVRAGAGDLEVRFPTSPTPEGAQRFVERKRAAAVAAVRNILRPDSVVVVGASRRRGTVGGEVLRSIVDGGYRGRLAAVNPHAVELAGVPCHPDVADVPFDVDLAILAVPQEALLDVARACARKGVRAVVALSGSHRRGELLAICRAAGMRLVGPDSLGVVNTDPGVSLHATFSPGSPPAGRTAFASQSGAFGIAAIDLARARGLGLSSFVSLGDKADLSGNDFLQFWDVDDCTDVVLLYLESFGNPRRFGRIARRISATKPLVAVKSGRPPAGPPGALSHTAALVAAADHAVDALFEHAGVIRAGNVDEMFDVAALLTRLPAPPGDRLAIVSNAAGPALMCAEALSAAGVRSAASHLALEPAASAEAFGAAVAGALEEADAVVTIFVNPLATRAADVLGAVSEAGRGRALIAVFLGEDVPGPGPIPVFRAVEQAARALALVLRDAARRRRGAEEPLDVRGIDSDRAAAAIASCLATGGGRLGPDAVEEVLAAYGIHLAAAEVARSPHAAGRAASRLGGPVALKALSPGLVHKSDVQGVELGLPTASAVARAARAMRERLEARGLPVEGFLVQRMAEPGPELLVGAVSDPQFGPLVAVAAGGTAAELIGDVQVRLAPVGPATAAEMLRSLRTFPLLDGYRGSPRADVAAVEDVIVRVGALAAAHPEVAELDCNPVVAGPSGAVVVDAHVRLEPAAPPRPYGALDR